MTTMFLEIPPPANWQDFERLTLDMCKEKWKDDHAEPNGRQGQKQDSVDVYGYNHDAKESTGVQCKKRSGIVGDIDKPVSVLTQSEIDKEIAAASMFTPPLQRFIIATTAPRDKSLQSYARQWNVTHAGAPFFLNLWFWDTYEEWLNKNQNFLVVYYSEFMEAHKNNSPIERYLRLLAMAFNRPALRTNLSVENRATDLVQALADTQNAINTGRLTDREGRIIAQVALPKQRIPELEYISRLLQTTRGVVSNAVQTATIIQHATVIEVKDQKLVTNLNNLRRQALDELNALLEKNKVDAVVWHDY
jgi:hypothetical protein